MKENEKLKEQLSEKVSDIKSIVSDNKDVIKAVAATAIVLKGLNTLTRRKCFSNQYIAKTFTKDIYSLIKGKKILGLSRAQCSDVTELMSDADECLRNITSNNPSGKYVLAIINYK